MKINNFLIKSYFDFSSLHIKSDFLKKFFDNKNLETKNLLLNLVFCFINAKLITENEGKFYKSEILKNFVVKKLLTNFVKNFNDWVVSRKFSKMDLFVIKTQQKKIFYLKKKDFRLENYNTFSDLKTNMEIPLKKSKQKNNKKTDSFIEEVEFTTNEGSFTFLNKEENFKFLKKEEGFRFLDVDKKLCRVDSSYSIDYGTMMMKNNLSRNSSITSGFHGSHKYNF